MSFTIPPNTAAFNENQSIWMQADIDALVAAFNNTAVLNGCAVTAQGSPDMTVAVAAGVVVINGVSKAVTAANGTITAADATLPRIDLVSINSSGAIVVTAGTPAVEPGAPALPASSALVAMVYVPANDTTIASNQITDKRVITRGPIILRKTADESVTSSAVLQDDDHLTFPVNASEVVLIEGLLVATGNSAGDISVALMAPAGTVGRFSGVGPDIGATDIGNTNVSSAAITDVTTPDFLNFGVVTSSIGSAISVRALLVIGGTAGTVKLQWAQRVSNGTATVLEEHSHLIVTRVP